MTFETMGSVGLDYLPCRYGHSKLLFRGPRRRLEGAYCIALGGTETYGKYIHTPFPALLEKAIRIPVVNLGLPNAGIDVFLNEAVVLDACNGARATIIQLPGAQNMSNRFYSVHPRRNDRFLQASAQMFSPTSMPTRSRPSAAGSASPTRRMPNGVMSISCPT